MLKLTGAISASSNLPTLQPDDVREIRGAVVSAGVGVVGGGGGGEWKPFNCPNFFFFFLVARLKGSNKAVMMVLFHLSARRH